MFELTFLGTSASAPSIKRGLSSLVVQHDEYRFMVDCGEGTQRQILKSGIGFKRLNHILLTHGHLDHILGLAGLLSTFLRWEAIEEVNIYGSRHTMERVDDLINGVVLRRQPAEIPVNLFDIKPGLIFSSEKFQITAFNVDHRGSGSLGFRFDEFGRRPFIPEAAEALAIPPGPWRKDLVAGMPITLPDGRVIQPDEVLGKERQGTSLVVVGDTGRPQDLLEDVRNADGLVIEATYLKDEIELAKDFGHTTAAESAQLAKDAGVRQLFLTHISRRYGEKEVQEEAQAVFENTIVARDFDTYFVKREE